VLRARTAHRPRSCALKQPSWPTWTVTRPVVGRSRVLPCIYQDDLNEIAVAAVVPSRITDAAERAAHDRRADVAGNVDALVHATSANESRSEHPPSLPDPSGGGRGGANLSFTRRAWAVSGQLRPPLHRLSPQHQWRLRAGEELRRHGNLSAGYLGGSLESWIQL